MEDNTLPVLELTSAPKKRGRPRKYPSDAARKAAYNKKQAKQQKTMPEKQPQQRERWTPTTADTSQLSYALFQIQTLHESIALMNDHIHILARHINRLEEKQ